MQLTNHNEIFGEFAVLNIKSTIDEAVLYEVGDYLVKRLNLNYKDLYQDNLFFQVLANTPEEGHSCSGCEMCLGSDLVLKCTMCQDNICPAPKGVYALINDKLEISEIKVPICTDCYEKHKILPIGTVNKFVADIMRDYINNLIAAMNGKEINMFLVC